MAVDVIRNLKGKAIDLFLQYLKKLELGYIDGDYLDILHIISYIESYEYLDNSALKIYEYLMQL